MLPSTPCDCYGCLVPPDDAVSLPVSMETMSAQLSHLVIVSDLTAKSVERIESDQEQARQERRRLERVSRTLSHAALQLAMSKAMELVIPPVRTTVTFGLVSFFACFIAQIVAVKFGIQPFAFAR